MFQDMYDKIKKKKVKIGVIGLGYVGLPLAVESAKAGYKTLGIDVQSLKVDKVNRGENYISDIDSQELFQLVESKGLEATTDFSKVKSLDIVIICVPTPLDGHQQPDLSYIEEAAGHIAEGLHKEMIVILESTTYPGTTEELVKPILEKVSGLICSKDFYLAFSPERVDPGNALYSTKNTPKVIGGVGVEATEISAVFYREILESEVYTVSSPKVAEMEKILENTYRNVNIGLINEIGRLCNEMGISVWEVIDAAKTKPYGFQAFYPGPGLGGHCIPLDPYYLSWKAREFGFHTTLVETSMVINDSQPSYCAGRARNILNNMGKAAKGSRILVIGVAYKQDVNDCRESASIHLIQELKRTGVEVDFYDPYVEQYKEDGIVQRGLESLEPKIIKEYDLIIIATAHTNIDYQMIQENAGFIFDTRNATKVLQNKVNIEVL